MRFLKTVTTSVAALATAMTIGMGSASSKEVLTISSWAPPSHGVNALLWPRFIKMIEEATEGRVTAQIKYKLASPPAQFDLVQDGAADFTWIFHGYNPGRYTATKLIELPGYKGSAEAASVASWRVYSKYLTKLNEHKGVKLIGLMTHGPGIIHSNKDVSSLAKVKGLKLRLPGGVASEAGAALGAKSIKVPAPKVYETLASNAADGVTMPFEGRKGFKLTEVAKNVLEMPNGGFYRGSFALIMNEDKFKSLSKKDQDALSKLFGEELSKIAGQMWDKIDVIGRKATKDAGDNTITVASEADQKTYAAIGAKIKAKLIADLKAKGVDGAAAVDFITKEMASYGK